MKDQYERNIDYMRISITDRCNLRCRYCMPEEGIECNNHEDILTFEEIIQIAEAGAGIGIRKIKITGGEPLVRKGCSTLVESLKRIPGIEEVTLTTNGVLLSKLAEDLYMAGLDAVNISLDTLSPMKYFSITRRDLLKEVMKGIERAYQIGLKTKINSVVMKGVNENEIPMLAAIAMKNKIDVRFIELMPVGLGRNYEYISVKEVQEILKEVYGSGKESNIRHGNGPAVYLNYEGFQGSIGFISAMSNEFCNSCNRIRLTSEGELKLCLNHNRSISLRTVIRKYSVEAHDSKGRDLKEYDSKERDSKEHDSEVLDSKEYDSKEHESEAHDSKECDSKEHESEAHDSKEYDSKEHESEAHDSKECDSKEHDSKEHDSKEHDSKEHDSKEHDSKEHDSEEHDSEVHDLEERYFEGNNSALQNSVEHNLAKYVKKEQCLKEELQEIMKEFIYEKPLRHCFQTGGEDAERRKMVQIGG